MPANIIAPQSIKPGPTKPGADKVSDKAFADASAPAAKPAAPDNKLHDSYYLENFNFLVTFVTRQYEQLFNTDERQFSKRYKKLSVNAQKLYARLVMRTSSHLRLSKINYPDIQVSAALDELGQSGLVNPDIDAVEHCLPLFTQRELSDALGTSVTDYASLDASLWTTPDLFGDSPSAKLFTIDHVIEVNFKQTIQTFRLLFFGNLHQDFSSFVLRDLGYQRFESYQIDRGNLLFKTRTQIDTYLAYYACSEHFDEACEQGIEALSNLHAAMPEKIPTDSALCRRLDRLNNNIARQLERESALDIAACIYNKTSHPPARERLARIMAKNGDTEQALSLCRQIYESPRDSDELDFASHFGQSLARKTDNSFPTDNKYKPPESTIQLTQSNLSVEFSVATHLAKTGKCYYLENNLISGIFGLAFWDIIFAPVNGVFFHPFQSRPADLYEPEFSKKREILISDRFVEIENGRLRHIVNYHLYHKRGIRNPLVNWLLCRKHIVDLALRRIPTDDWHTLFTQLLTDIRNYKSGQPDLIYFPDAGGYQFIEVKAPGDKLQKNQLRWMRHFKQQGIAHRIVNVEWVESVSEGI